MFEVRPSHLQEMQRQNTKDIPAQSLGDTYLSLTKGKKE